MKKLSENFSKTTKTPDKLRDPENSKDPFMILQDLVYADMKQVNNIAINLLKSHAALIMNISKYLLNAGGKRLRPMLTLASGILISGKSNKDCIALACAVEFLHTATLLHDDVVDNGTQRRGKETANIIWGNKESILVGDYLLGKSFELMVSTSSIKVLEILSKTSSAISEAEVWQLDLIGKISISIEDYLKMIESKTAILFAASCASGAIVSGCTNEQREGLYSFGLNLGISFQIMDDILDYVSSTTNLGKKVGSDYYEGKITLPLILSYQLSTDDEKLRIKSEILKKTPESLELIRGIMLKYNAIERAIEIAQSFVEKGKKSLSIFKDCDIKNTLCDVISYSTKRKS